MSVTLGAGTLPNPVVAASGTFGHGDELAALCDPARLGAVTTKSVAAYPWAGNAARRVTETAGGMLNSVGLPGPGIDVWNGTRSPRARSAAARVGGTRVRRDVAMTGEITLRGDVLPIGGVKEKVLAARRAGIGTVILPKANRRDLAEVPKDVRRDMKFVFAARVDDVLSAAFTGPATALRPPKRHPAAKKPGKAA